MPVLKINVGDGLGFDQNDKLCVRYAGENIRVVDTGTDGQIGLYVDDLTGLSGSVSDNWSTVPGPGYKTGSATISNFVDINRDVTNLIFTYGAYQVANRGVNGQNHISYSASVKTIQNLVDEMNFPISIYGRNRTFYQPFKSEMIQLVDGPSTSLVSSNNSGGTIAAENGNRLGDNTQTTKVLFVITDIKYDSDINPGGNEFWVNSITLLCIYSSLTEYVVGHTYSV